MTVKPKRRGSKEPAGPSTPALGEADASSLTFVGRRSTIKTPVAQCSLARTIEGASSITVNVHDPHLQFLNSDAIRDVETIPVHKTSSKHSPLVRKANLHSVVVLDNLVWALTGIGLQDGHLVQAILEEDAVKALRNTKPLTMSRGAVTRAQFIKRMFDDAGVPLVCPELDIKQRIETPQEAESDAQKARKRKSGIAGHASITVKQKPADPEQRANIELCLEIAAGKHAGELASIALLEAVIQESEARNLSSGDGTSKGILQLLDSTAAGLGISQRDIAACVTAFLDKGFYGKGGAIALAKEHPTWSAGQIAQAVQGSAFPEAYGVWKAEATKMVAAYTGGDTEGLTGESVTYAKSYQFQRKRGETSWACAKRLANEVNWYLFIEGGVGYYMSGRYLKRSKPRMLVAPGADGIRKVTFNVMEAPTHNDLITVECDAKLWQAPPGSIAEVEGYGPVDDRWVVTDINRAKMSSSITIVTLGRLKEPKLEPAHEVGTRSVSVSAQGYTNPFAQVSNLTPERVDMGVDYAGKGVIVALGDGEVTFAANTSGWEGGGCVVLKLTSGPYEGKSIFHAEHVTMRVKVGDKVRAGEPLCTMNGGTESGWASGNGAQALAAALGQQKPDGDPGGWESAAGASFNRLLVALGVPPGTKNPGGGPHGAMPAGYP